MADDLVTEDRWNAGADYLASLRKLGFEPDALLWAQNDETKEMVLVIISPIVERVGSTDIYDTLFKAYDHAITPKSIDPWIVSVYSPSTILSRDFHDMMNAEINIEQHIGPNQPFTEVFLGVVNGAYSFRKSWVYVARNSNMERRRQDWMWRKFSDNVDRLAA